MSEEPVRVLALWSPDWPVTAAARAAHVPAHVPAAVFVANRVLACSAVARAQGIRRGLRRREAQARCPDLAVLAPDPDRDARAFEPVVAAVEELAPGVEVVRPGLVALPAQGPVGHFGGELVAAERLVDRVAARTGAECQVGLADGLFAAVLAARRGVAVSPGDTPAFLAPLEVGELDREPDVDRSELVDLLHRLGLRSLGAFGALDASDVASRFGADAVLAHRLARGLDPRPPVRRHPPEELTVELELDPPVDRVDMAAFAARGLAERLHRTLAGHGLSCTRLGVAARTVAGEQLVRIWRCAEPLTPAGTVDRVRWQLDSWLTRGGSGAVDRLWLVPEETVTAGALQLGLWGEVGEADERAGRALVRVQALLGPESVVTAVLVGGREPAERVRLVPWGDSRDLPGTAVAGPTGEPAVAEADLAWTAGPSPTDSTIGEQASGPVGLGPVRTAGPAADGSSGRPVGPAIELVPEAVAGVERVGGSLDAGPGAGSTTGSAERTSVGLGSAGSGSAGSGSAGSGSAGRSGSASLDPAGLGSAGPVGSAGRPDPADRSGPGGPAREPDASAGGSAEDTPSRGAPPPVPRTGTDPGAVPPGPGVRATPTDALAPLDRGDSAPAPAGWPGDVLLTTGRSSATAPPEEPTPRPTNRRRRPPARRSTPRSPGHEPPAPWPGRLPPPSPAVVVADPVPVELLDADGLAVRLAEPDLLSAPPVVLAGIPGPAGAREPRAVSAWAGPWPVVQRWWAAEGRATSRLQLVCADGTAYLLTTGEGRWWVTGVYD